MIRVSSAEFDRDAGRYQDVALSEPVMVTRDGHDSAVLISAEEYRRLNRQNRQAFAAGDLPDDVLEAARDAKMDPRHAALDDLIVDWQP